MRKFIFLLFFIMSLQLTGAYAMMPENQSEQVPFLDMAYIQDNALVSNLLFPTPEGVIARYTGVDLGAAMQKITCTVRFTEGGAVALISGAIEEWSVEGITTGAIHAVFASDGYHFGFYENGTLTDVLADNYQLDLSGETEYTVGYSISGSTITLQLPNGKKIQKRDPRVKSLNGTRVIFEHFLTGEDAAAGASVAITSVYAKANAKKTLKDDFKREDGLPLQAPSGHVYYQFRNESASDY